MSELKTTLNRSDGVISSQNKILNHYAVQLQSAVVSTDHKKAILREMQLELTAQHYRRPEHRSVAYEVTHSSSVKLEMSSQPSLIQTGGQVSAPSVKTAVDNSFIKTQRSTEYIRTSRLTYSDSVKEVFKASENLEEKILEADKLWQKKVKARAIGIKQRGLENQKYTTAETDSEGSEAIEMVKTVQSAGSTVAQTGGMLRTAVKSASNGIGSIKTMACCPFHEDSTPSLKVYDDHFYCFGCGETGDCTGFTAKLFGLTQIEAAKKISYDFSLHLFNGEIAVPVNKVMQAENEYKAWLKNATAIVDEYLNKLIEWRKIYAPKNPAESLHPLFVESLKKQGYIEYLSDYLRFGTDKEKRELFNEDRKSISDIRERLDKLAADGRTVKRKAI